MAEAATHAPRRIAIFGGGLTGLSAATAFARALPLAQVALIATPTDPAALADRMSGTLSSIQRFNAEIGFGDDDMVRRAGAIHRLGIVFENWSVSGALWVHAYTTATSTRAPLLHHHWVNARAGGDPTPFHAHHPGAMLGLAGRFVPPDKTAGSPLAGFDQAFTIDPAGYRAGLTALAQHRRVALSDGRIGEIARRDDGTVAAVLLDDGRRIEADLFVDCTGPEATLLSRIDPAFEEWDDALPCDRLLVAAAPPALSLLESVSAIDAGWCWRAPARGRSSIGLAYASDLTPPDEAARLFERHHRAPPVETIAIRPGRRPASWIGNVVAFGDAAVAVDPLEDTNLHLAHSAILRALDLLPGRDFLLPVLNEFNRRTREETMRVRDFLSLHYLRSGRTSGAFWRQMAGRRPSDSLETTLTEFAAIGRLPHFEEESFDRDDWLMVLLGMGVLPKRIAATALEMSDPERGVMLRRNSSAIGEAVNRAPDYRAAFRPRA